MDDIEYQRQIIDTFINAIYVYDDKLVFTYNFKDGTETVPLKAVEDAFGSDLTQVAPPNPRNPNFIPIGIGFGFLFLRHKTHICPYGTAQPRLREYMQAHFARLLSEFVQSSGYTKKSPRSR